MSANISPEDLQRNLLTVRAQLAASSQSRQPPVTLIAVSKTRPPEQLRSIHQYGQKDFGENYVQEAVTKITALSDLDIVWHFIGPIQKNKTRLIAEHFAWVHSIDRAVIAERLNQQRPDHLPALNVCLQINIDDEATKSGIYPHQLSELAECVKQLPRLNLAGLMAIPSAQQGFSAQYETFTKLRLLLASLQLDAPQATTLSMGMSNDYQAAIAAGATMVRIGTALFGPRNYPQE